jgi:hypothetical protein
LNFGTFRERLAGLQEAWHCGQEILAIAMAFFLYREKKRLEETIG